MVQRRGEGRALKHDLQTLAPQGPRQTLWEEERAISRSAAYRGRTGWGAHPQWRPITSNTKVLWWLQEKDGIYSLHVPVARTKTTPSTPRFPGLWEMCLCC